MKTLKNLFVVSILFFVTTAANLNSEYAKVTEIEPVVETMKLSTWSIKTLTTNNENKDEIFAGCHFEFTNNESFNLVSTHQTIQGKWEVTKSKKTKNDKGINLKFSFNKFNKYSLLCKNWRVVERSDSKVKLIFTDDMLSLNYILILEKSI